MSFPIERLLVMHNRLRRTEQLPAMSRFVREGGVFDRNAMLVFATLEESWHAVQSIKIAEFEDGTHYLHDGHHRAAAICIGGRDSLFSTEYEIEKFSYEDYLEINIKNHWYTPFDPRSEVRLPDFWSFKSMVDSLLKVSEGVALEFIAQGKELYAEKRRVWTVDQLSESCRIEQSSR